MWGRNRLINMVVGSLAGATALTLVACAGSGSGSSSSGIAVTGTLTQLAASSKTDPVTHFQQTFATSGTQLSVDCGLSGIYTATVNSTTGAFSASGVPTGVPCTFNFVSSSGIVKCQVEFQDSSDLSLNNNPMSSTSAIASANMSLGSITCDTTGNITVPTSNVSGIDSSATVSNSVAFDPTGVWTIAAYSGALPTGYQTVSSCSSNCHGPSVGMNVSLIRFHGDKFTPNSGLCTPAINVTCPVTDGTVDTASDGYAISIWGGDYAHGIGACGGNTGFTADEARAYAHLSLDSTPPSLAGNALTYAHYSWSTQSGFGADVGWTEPWMYGGATSSYNVYDCEPVSVPSTTAGVANKPGFACYTQIMNGSTGTGNYVWNVGLQNDGGCVDANGNPLMVSNWANLTGTCTNTASTFNSNMNTGSCSYTGSPDGTSPSESFTCTYTGGMFTDISGSTGSTNDNTPNFSAPATIPAGDYTAQPATYLAKGAACADSVNTESSLITTASGAASASQAAAAKELLARYQCYANAYWQHAQNGAGSTTCDRDYNFNWSTNNYANFVIGDDRSMMPQNAFLTDRVFYSPDGTWMFMKHVDTKFQTVPTSSGGQLCPFKTTTQLKIHELSANLLLVDFSQTTQMTDTSATCQGAVDAALAGGGTLSPDPQGLNNLYQQLQAQKMIFEMTK